MHSLILFAALLGSTPSAVETDAVQTDGVQTDGVQTATPRRPWSVTAAYVGELLLRPGAQVGLEYALAARPWLSLLGRANLGGYVHYRYAVALYADVELGARATTTGGFVVDLLGNLGYLHQFPNGVVYQVPSGATAVVVSNAGYPALRLGGTLGLGVDLTRTSLKWPATVVLRLGAFEERPFAGGSQLHPEAQIALSWTLG